MNRRLSLSVITCTALALSLAGRPARAASVSSTLTVTATVVRTCEIDPALLAFGSYDPGADSEAEANITVRCTHGTTFAIVLDGTNGDRAMSDGLDSLSYALYSDAARTAAWEFPNAVTTFASSPGVGLGEYQVPVYGRIPGGQASPAGLYTDSLTMTVNF
jgi:spore coat protein U-like protein